MTMLAVDQSAMDLVITCGRHPGINILHCECPKDWLANRALWVAAERELEKLRRNQLDVEKVKADAQEFTGAALKDFEKLNKKIEALTKELRLALFGWTRCMEGTQSIADSRAELDRITNVLTKILDEK